MHAGRFRDDLLARINLWMFRLPALRDRPEDITPNLDHELDAFARRTNRRVRFNTEARERFLAFASSPGALWSGNFRDLAGSVTRMATLAPGGRIGLDAAEQEIDRLRSTWSCPRPPRADDDPLSGIPGAPAALDLFDRVQLAEVVRICRRSASLSEAGRELFAVSRTSKA